MNASSNKKSKLAFIIDDDQHRIDNLSDFLKSEGFEVRVYENKPFGHANTPVNGVNRAIQSLNEEDRKTSIFIVDGMHTGGRLLSLLSEKDIPTILSSLDTGQSVNEEQVNEMRKEHKKPFGFYQYTSRSDGGKGFEPAEVVRIANETIEAFAQARGTGQGR